ncbi:uncharacterized protein AAG666_021131 [Megaptera novaeangliae]
MAGGGGPGPGRRRWRRPCTTEGGVRGAPTARHPQSPATRRPARRCAPAEFSRGPGGKPSVPSARGAPGQARLRRRAPVTLSQASSGQRQGGAGSAWGASSCLYVRLSVRLSEALAQVKARGQGCRAPSRWEPARLRPLGPVCPGRPRASRSAPLQGARGPGFSKLRSAGEEAGARRVRRAGAGNGSSRPRAPGLGSRTGQLTIHQRVKRDRRQASSLFGRLGAQQELLKDNTAPGTIPRVRQGCPTGAQTPGPSAGGPRPSGRPRGGERRSRAEACRGAAIGASARREVVVPSPQESRPTDITRRHAHRAARPSHHFGWNKPPGRVRLSEPFQSAHNKCARHRMHHLPPQIRALMGRQIAVCGGHSGAWCRVACLPASGTRVGRGSVLFFTTAQRLESFGDKGMRADGPDPAPSLHRYTIPPPTPWPRGAWLH